MEMRGQTALVTGAGSGIGRAIAVALAAEGCNVIVHCGHNRAAAEETVALCKAAANQADREAEPEDALQAGKSTAAQTSRDAGDRPALFRVMQADLRDPDAVTAMFKEAAAMTGRIDILINNAGMTKDGLVLRMKPEQFDEVVKTNLYSTFYCMKAASRLMLRQRCGRIVSIASIVGIHGNAGQVSYAASKAGIIGMTKSLAKELASRGITVNAIAPGMIRTRMTESLDENVQQAMTASIPLGYPGEPEDVANAAVFLASPASRYITGQVLGVDGGMGC